MLELSARSPTPELCLSTCRGDVSRSRAVTLVVTPPAVGNPDLVDVHNLHTGVICFHSHVQAITCLLSPLVFSAVSAGFHIHLCLTLSHTRMDGRERKTENEKNKIHICKLRLVLSRPLNVYFKSGYCKYK